MGECNACMKRIVAAPTAGACGVLPAVLVPYVKKYEPEEEKVLDALYTAAGIGQGHRGQSLYRRSQRRLSGRDWFCFWNGSSGNLQCTWREVKEQMGTCLRHGT